jgi:hypothetical protein
VARSGSRPDIEIPTYEELKQFDKKTSKPSKTEALDQYQQRKKFNKQ